MGHKDNMTEVRTKSAKRAGVITIILALCLVGVKAVAWAMSGSVSVLASLSDSVMDAVVSGMNWLAVRYSSKPADEDHRYGHGKIEGLAALAQALLLAGVSIFVGIEAIHRWQEPQALTDMVLVTGMMIVSLIGSAIIIMVQKKSIAESGSLAIEADHAHYSADVVQHALVIAALCIAYFDGPLWVDLLAAVIITLWMLMSAYGIARKGIDMILDRELPMVERKALLEVIKAHPQVLGVHDLRAIKSGMKELIFFDIEAAPEMSLHDAHAITRDLENAILKIYPYAEIMIHVDPHGEIEDSRHTVASIHH
ncbi:MAG: hypothetical protein CL570_07215 [Alphaproteobacteria bacterium]|nr:hypothetical protein [Alphaproteobacteria bacterium]HCQ70628.1 hypothetical protein [Rhodospirillaceae bacterium]|tara:strand:+ start:12445 stop:13374 length:930 start_codon:yes stop_codon:yes gene_type:complete